jgi:nucleotide-binding universal stress UspA family protein
VRDIAVHSPGYRTWHGSVRYAAQLAASMQAALTGLFVAPRTAPAPGPPRLAAEVVAYAQDDLQQAMLAGRDFAAWASQLGVSDTFWQVAIGQPPDVLAMIGDWHDLVVLQGHASPGLASERLICEVLLSGTACIVVPEASIAPGGPVHAMVAWNGTAASTRALHAALPLLRAAEEVSLLQQSAEHGGGAGSGALAHLRAHNVPVRAVETVAGSDEAASEHLLDYAGDTRADLIVMGASGGRRSGERCLGPTTSSLLARSRLPVFLRF